jgi:hypothetical protein
VGPRRACHTEAYAKVDLRQKIVFKRNRKEMGLAADGRRHPQTGEGKFDWLDWFNLFHWLKAKTRTKTNQSNQ